MITENEHNINPHDILKGLFRKDILNCFCYCLDNNSLELFVVQRIKKSTFLVSSSGLPN